MKKVAVFRTDLLPLSETFIREQVLALTQWTCVLVGYRKINDGLGLDSINIRMIPGLSTGNLHRWRLRLCQWMGVAHAPTVRVLREIDANLIHVHFGTDAVDIWPSVRKLGLPMLVTLHGYDINIHREWWESGRGGMRRRRYPRQLIRLAKESNIHFAAVSTAIRARAIKLGIPSEKITVSHIGVDTKIFQPGPIPIPDRSKRVLFVGRLVEKKGAAYLIRAFAKLDKAHPGAELIIVGDGILRDELQRLAVELNVRVQFLGSQSTHEVWRQMQFAQVLCAPSVTALNGDAEGLPIVILEALACGLPVFTSAAGAEFLKNGDAGINHAEGDINALADLLSRILKHDPLIIRQTKEARRVATEKFDIAVCIEHLEHIYSELEKKRT